MSVILITPDKFQTLHHIIRAYAEQTVRKNLELVIVAPSAESLDIVESDLECFSGYQVVEIGAFDSNAVARAAGVRAARTPLVVFAEDHCFPAPDYAEHLIARHREAWSGVGPRIHNANPRSAVSRVNFLIEYGAWVGIEIAAPMNHIPGHCGSYKREALLEYGEELEVMLAADSPMQWDMQERGHRFFLETAAVTFHLNFSKIWPSIAHRFHAGREFACYRARKWSNRRRWVYALGSPLIPLVRLYRLTRDIHRRARLLLLPGTFFTLAAFLMIDGMGEMVGYATKKANKATRIVSDWEFHHERFIHEKDRALLTDVVELITMRKP